VNRLADPGVGAAAANIPRHGCIDVGIAGFWIALQKRRGRHDLPRLTVTALGHVDLEPRFLHRVAAIPGKPLDGGNGLALDGAQGQHAGARRGAVDVHGAGAAQSHPAAKFGAGHAEVIAQHPEQGGICFGVHVNHLIIEGYCCHCALVGEFPNRPE